jgi:hypothetical protein
VSWWEGIGAFPDTLIAIFTTSLPALKQIRDTIPAKPDMIDHIALERLRFLPAHGSE